MDSKLSIEVKEKLELLFDWLSTHDCVLAFSGGVDSTTLAKALVLSHSQRAKSIETLPPWGFLAESPSSTELEKSSARKLATEIGLKLEVIQSDEFSDERFIENSPLRCYWCKKLRFSCIRNLANEKFSKIIGKDVIIIDGTNADDAGDYRPGSQAAREVGVKSPFAEIGFTKAQIRELARYWGLSVAEKPSNPCLATRVAYNLTLNNDLLRQIENAEIIIREVLQVDTCRARVDVPGVVRIEVKEDSISQVLSYETRKKLVDSLRELGFNFVTLDLEGFFSGKNNRILKS